MLNIEGLGLGLKLPDHEYEAKGFGLKVITFELPIIVKELY